MLTTLLRDRGHEVLSFVEKAVTDEGRTGLKFDVEKWINSKDGQNKFEYDTNGATLSDMVIYIGPSGIDAWAEVGAAWGCGKPVILGLWAKGEQVGLMRKMVAAWFSNYQDLLIAVDEWGE